MTTLLLVEDDEDLAAMLGLAMRSLGHEVRWASTGDEGLAMLAAAVPDTMPDTTPDVMPDVVLLDVMMPGIDGFETLRRIRAHRDAGIALVPVVMLTARSDAMDIVAGLECGADDYVTKPVEPRVLEARVKALLRRARPVPDADPVIEVGDLRIDDVALRVTRDGVPLDLTATEMRLLIELAHHLGQVLSRHQLLASVWDYGYAGDSRLVDAAVQRLRAKIEPDPAHPRHLHTVRGLGYRLDRP